MLLYTLKDYEKNQTQYNVLTTFLKKKDIQKKRLKVPRHDKKRHFHHLAKKRQIQTIITWNEHKKLKTSNMYRMKNSGALEE